MKRISKLTVKQTAAVAGETRNVKAVLTSGNDKLAGRSVTFRFEGKLLNGQNVVLELGTDKTNADGEATFPWKVPELARGPHTLTASYAGDDETMWSTDEAPFGTVAGITKFELGDAIYGALDAHGGPKYHTVMIRLRRQADQEALNKVVKITINGGPEQSVNLGQSGMSTMLLQPTNAPQWTLKAEFPGDEANQATSLTRTYTRSPGS